MKTVYYWSPYLSNVATIRAVINSAASLKKYSKTYNPIIINSCGEFNKYKKELEIDGIEIVTLLSFNLFKFLPSRGFLLSRFSYILIFILTFFPLLIFIKSKKPDYLIMHLITSLPILISNLIKTKTKYILRISGLPKYNFLRKVFWKKFSRNIHKVTCPTEDTIKDKINFKLLIIGRGTNLLKMREFINENQLSKKIKILTFKKNPFPYLKKADLFLLTSKYEGLPNVLLEAISLKKNIVSTNCPTGPREILKNGKFGFLCEVENYKEISKTIITYKKLNRIKKNKIKELAYKSLQRFDYDFNLNKYYLELKKLSQQ